MRSTTLSYSCERRSEYIGDGEICVQAFLHCCKTMESQRAEAQEDNLQLARSKGPWTRSKYMFGVFNNIFPLWCFSRGDRQQLHGHRWNYFSNPVPRKLAVVWYHITSMPGENAQLVSNKRSDEHPPMRTSAQFKARMIILLQWHHFICEKRSVARLNHHLAVYWN